ncbi:hypothetical protein VCRA2127O15_90124 [Vibrio crassostreae]|nr:hypothetical protein VCRA2127O15_90124 [Vibrio crassostreae]CAK3719301.1 hypothetical protein VCRA2123O13_80077 [Vibrio crassostreae]CAK3956975.1 hypothetical protein VCRA2120O6_70077 [Vibrio crassostreae]
MRLEELALDAMKSNDKTSDMECKSLTWMVEKDDFLILCDDALSPTRANDWL